MNRSKRSGRYLSLSLTLLLLLSAGLTAAEAGAGRTRPGGGNSGGGSSGGGRTHAAGRAGYGHGGHHGHGGHYGHGGYGYGYGYGYGAHYGYYGHYYPYSWWHWGWATVPYYVVPSTFMIDGEAPGAIETVVSPKKASVIVDGEWLGQARDYNGRLSALWLEPGEHQIEFSRDGYLTLRRNITVRPGMQLRIEEQLEKGSGDDPRSELAAAAGPPEAVVQRSEAPKMRVQTEERSSVSRGLLRLEVEPADAAIYLDGEFLARAEELTRLHGALPVATGVHRLEVVRPGYESQELEVDVSDEAPKRVEIQLQPKR